MHTVDELLALAKKHQQVVSDYALSKLLACRASTIGHYRHGRSMPDDAVAIRLAELAKLPPAYVAAVAHAGRSTEPDVRQLWADVAALALASKPHATRSASKP